MKKIPTLYLRDPNNPKHVTREPNPACLWVFEGEGDATIKWDGTCVAIFRDGNAYARREVKSGKPAPAGFTAIERDLNTGKTVGWEPAEQSGFAKWISEAITVAHRPFESGTYELVGPKVNGNPHNQANHVLIRHGAHTLDAFPRTFAEIPQAIDALHWPINPEGVVFHHPDGRKAKIKRRDFPAKMS